MKAKVISVYYSVYGMQHKTSYDANWYDMDDAKRELEDLMPDAVVDDVVFEEIEAEQQ